MGPMSKIDFAIGGQALIEGVMMRSPSHVTVAVRRKDGSIVVKGEKFIPFAKRLNMVKVPIIRGILNFVEMMIIGTRALNFSAEQYAEDWEEEDAKKTKEKGGATDKAEKSQESPDDKAEKIEEKPGGLFSILSMVASILISLGLAIVLFKFVPLYLTELIRSHVPYIADHYILFNVIDGAIRIIIFFLYISLLSLSKSIRRVFEYHGAEHMTVHAYEHHKELTVKEIEVFSPRHPRCGTSFIIAVLLVSIIFYTFIPRNPVFILNLLQRIALLPIIAGIGYEVLKWSAKYVNHPLMKIIVGPGILTQFITTKQPDSAQIEVAMAALKKALELEKNDQADGVMRTATTSS